MILKNLVSALNILRIDLNCSFRSILSSDLGLNSFVINEKKNPLRSGFFASDIFDNFNLSTTLFSKIMSIFEELPADGFTKYRNFHF